MKSKLTYANVMVSVLLFVVLGGGAYAATKLGKGQVRARNIAADAVSGSKVKDGSLTAADLNQGGLGTGLLSGGYSLNSAGGSGTISFPPVGKAKDAGVDLGPASAFEVRDLAFQITGTPGTGFVRAELRANSQPTGLECTITGSETSCSDTEHVASIPPSARLGLEVTVSEVQNPPYEMLWGMSTEK